MDLKTLLRAQWDRAAAIACTALGALLLLFGWIGVSGTPFLAEQAPYILSGGVGGVFFLGVGATLWISGDLRDEWRKLDRIEAALRDGVLRYVVDEPADLPSPRREGFAVADDEESETTQLRPSRRTTAGVPDVLEPPRKVARTRTASSRPMTTEAAAATPKRRRAGVGHA
jgi:hypothetical protein